jgi:hypothetical protein
MIWPKDICSGSATVPAKSHSAGRAATYAEARGADGNRSLDQGGQLLNVGEVTERGQAGKRTVSQRRELT